VPTSILTPFFDYADADFEGESFNGESLIATLEKLTPEAAASKATHEGYSAWAVAVHLAYWKFFLARSLDAEAAGSFPYQHDKHGFGEAVPVDEAGWKALIAYLRTIHATTGRLIRALDELRLAETMPAWKIPYAKAIAWYLGHDGYHTAQLRNMGVPGLREG
jgi:hypothetical protein